MDESILSTYEKFLIHLVDIIYKYLSLLLMLRNFKSLNWKYMLLNISIKYYHNKL